MFGGTDDGSVSQDDSARERSSAVPELAGLLDRVEVYYDTAPGASATAENIGPLTLFVATSGPYILRAAATWLVRSDRRRRAPGPGASA